MKKHIRIISVFLVCIFTCGLLAILSGCSLLRLLIPEADEERVNGDFIYSYISRAGMSITD